MDTFVRLMEKLPKFFYMTKEFGKNGAGQGVPEMSLDGVSLLHWAY